MILGVADKELNSRENIKDEILEKDDLSLVKVLRAQRPS